MKTLFVIILSLILLVSITSFAQAQTDTVKFDKVYMLDGSILDGNVKMIMSEFVVFVEKETQLNYEINKNDIKVIALANGKFVVFNNNNNNNNIESDNITVKSAPIKEKRSEAIKTTIEQTPGQVIQETNPSIQFSLAGLLGLSLQNWKDLKTDDSKLGFGIQGDLFAGIILDDMYVGIGPHFGYSFWTQSETEYGYSSSITTSIGDFGIGLGAAWEGFYMVLGAGSGNVSITANVGDESETLDIPEGIGYTRIEFGWYDGYLIGFALQNYSDDKIANNLSRIEFILGWAF